MPDNSGITPTMQQHYIIKKNIGKYLIFSDESILSAIKKICDNKSRVIFVVDDTGKAQGVLTDGDFRRWIISNKDINLNKKVETIANKNFVSVEEGADIETIMSLFNEKIDIIPILDDHQRIVSLITSKKKPLYIGNIHLSTHTPAFLIAEIGINHNGNMTIAKRLVREAKKSGADCVKFQMRHMPSLYRENIKDGVHDEDIGSQYTLDLLSKFQLSDIEMFELFDYCKSIDIPFICTPWDLKSLEKLEKYGMPAYKLASADATNHELVQAMAQTGKPLICSTGMSSEEEIKELIDILKSSGSQYILLHCNSTYPTPFKDVNLNYIQRLRDMGECLVGYSGHERGYEIAIAAIALGAKVVEKHFTLDKSMEGNDHKVSLLPEEFAKMVKAIRNAEQSLGSDSERHITQGELMNRNTLAKSIVATKDIAKGQEVTDEMISIRSPGKGLQPNKKKHLIGRKTKRDVKAGEYFYPSDIENHQIEPRDYQISRPWGVPVRYHDFKTILEKATPNFVEFHLSYKDLELSIPDHFKKYYNLDFTVHSPDIFSGDHLLDLADENKEKRQRSVELVQKVIKRTLELKKYFKKSTTPFVIVSLGGASYNHHLSKEQKIKKYDLIADSLSKIDSKGVEILPQTLPPFPWYFGGQLYLNLFVDAKDTVEFCKNYGYRLCWDVSHSKLACNYYKWSFTEFTDLVAPYTAHLHIADASGVDGEGLQIGGGDIDFVSLKQKLDTYCPKASFIPEIWQGHINNGEGFWQAMEKLEGYHY